MTISARELRALVLTFPSNQPITATAMKAKHSGWGDQQAHLDGWLAEYDGPGYYNRSGHGYDARHFYNHFQDGYGLLWLAEAVGVDRSIVEQGAAAISMEGKQNVRPGTRAAAFRKVCPWVLVEERIRMHLAAPQSNDKPKRKQVEGKRNRPSNGF